MNKLAVSDLRPFIPAKEFVQSKRFYASIGWRVSELDAKLALVTLVPLPNASDSSVAPSFYIQDYYLKDVAENCMLHLTVTDAQAWYVHLAAILRATPYGDARVQPPMHQAYGAKVTFLHDPTGVLLHLCQWLP
jgi:hypothetical protein